MPSSSSHDKSLLRSEGLALNVKQFFPTLERVGISGSFCPGRRMTFGGPGGGIFRIGLPLGGVASILASIRLETTGPGLGCAAGGSSTSCRFMFFTGRLGG